MNDYPEEHSEQATPWTKYMDKILYGVCFTMADGRRVDPTHVVPIWSTGTPDETGASSLFDEDGDG